MSKPINILVTGFGPFPGAPENPSSFLVETLAQQKSAHHQPHLNLTTGILPTHWRKVGPALDALHKQVAPDLALHLGYSHRSPGFQLESTAHNKTCEDPDVDQIPGTCKSILTHHPVLLTTSLPLDQIAAQMSASGYPASCSNDAGRYLCNMAYYLALARSRASLFLHIPAIETDGDLCPLEHEGDHILPLKDAVNGVELIISLLAEHREVNKLDSRQEPQSR